MSRYSCGVIAVFLSCLACSALYGQGYDTKFKAVGFKPGDVYQTDEGVSVSLNGGGLEVYLPLGPALPGPIPLRPMLNYHGKFSQGLNESFSFDAYFNATGDTTNALQNSWRRWSPPRFPSAALHPGKLTVNYGGGPFWAADKLNCPEIALTSPSGRSSEYYGGTPGMINYTSANQAEIQGILQALAPEWAYASSWGTEASGNRGFRTSDGSIFIYGPYDHQIVGMWDSYLNPDGSFRDVYTNISTDILQIDGDLITLWRQSRNVYKADRDERGVATNMRWQGSVYHPLWIKSRSGFKVNVEIYRDAPADLSAAPRNAAIPMVERGLLTGWKISYMAGSQEVGFKVDTKAGSAGAPITFFGMGNTPNTTGFLLTGATPEQVRNTFGWMPGTTDGWSQLGIQRFYDAEYTSDELQVGLSTTLTHGPLTTTFQWGGPSGLLDKLVTPSGKTYLFTYDTVTGVGVAAPSGPYLGGWTYNAGTPGALDFWTVVTKMEVQDGVGAQSRTTTYQWAIPKPTTTPGQTPGNWTWTSKNHGVAQTLPDGRTILHVFASPIDLPDVNYFTLDTVSTAKLFMAMRQSIVARYTFKSGDTSWQSFFSGSDPSTGTWYMRDLFEGWDFRGWEGALSKIVTNTEPRSTRHASEVRGGPVIVTEKDGWNPSINQYTANRSYTLPPSTLPLTQLWAPGAISGQTGKYVTNPGLGEEIIPGATSQSVTATTFASVSEGLYRRPAEIQTMQRLAPPTGTSGPLPKEVFTYDTAPGKAHVLTNKRQVSPDGLSLLNLTYAYAPQGLFTINRLVGVKVSGAAPNQASDPASLSTRVGASYSYDSTGRWMTDIKFRKGPGESAADFFPFTEREPLHDELGRPLSQEDANHFTSTFGWDLLGRLTGVSPASPEVGTTVAPDNSLRLVTLDRGGQRSRYHFNGFGELIAEERVKGDGTSSHRLFGFDDAGRKAWETVWRPSTPPLSLWTGALPGVGTRYDYDTRSRVIRTTNPNGEVVETRYDVGSDTLVTQQVIAPGSAREATTTLKRDVLGRLAMVIAKPEAASADLITTYAYDAAGRIRQVVQQNPDSGISQIRTWEYDGLGRLAALVQPESGRTEYGAYTVTGKPTTTVYGAGTSRAKVVTSSFDSLSRPLSITSSDATASQSFAYDEAGHGSSNGKLTASVDGDTYQSFTFGELNGRLSDFTITTGGMTFPQSFAYDTAGRRKLATVGGRKVVTAFEDATGWVNGVTYTGSDGVTKNVVDLTYDDTTWMPKNLAFGNGASTFLQYRPDQVGLGSLSHYASGGGSPLVQWAYIYDSAGNLKTDGEDSFDYDLLGRLKLATVKRLDGSSVSQTFTYDAFGNRLSSTASGNKPSSVINMAFRVDTVELNQRNQLPVQTDLGALTGAQYDEQGNLTYIWTKPGDPTTQLGLLYDALGRAIQMSDAARSGFVERYFYSTDGLRVRIEEYLSGVLQKTRFNIYNDQRQLVSKYRK